MSSTSQQLNPHASRPRRAAHPAGWRPHVETTDAGYRAISEPTKDSNLSERELILGWGLDPELWEIDGKINTRRWQANVGNAKIEWLYYYKADLIPRDKSRVDVERLCRKVLRRAPRTPKIVTSDNALVVACADWQVGKDDGDGLEGVLGRLARMVEQVPARCAELKQIGKPISRIYVCFLGDLGEGCDGHYAQQTYRVVLNVRDQRIVVRNAADAALEAWSRRYEVHVMSVGGNHGEERANGKSYTDFADNRDLASIEDVAFAYSKNPDRYANVKFFIPRDDLTLTFQHGDTVIGLAHGHQAGFTAGGDPSKKIENWWRGQMAGKQPIGDADILLTGHYHHPWMRTIGKRTHFGCPALEGASDWWRNTAGVQSAPGTLTFVVNGHGWSDMAIL